jgi:hypothetical protein
LPSLVGEIVVELAVPSAGDSWQDDHLAGIIYRCFEVSKTANVLVVIKDVDKTIDVAVLVTETRANTRIPILEVRDEVCDVRTACRYFVVASHETAKRDGHPDLSHSA